MIGVVAQVKRAFAARNRLALAVGFLLGGFVPIAIYFVAHDPSTGGLAPTGAWGLVGGGLLFSLQTVFQWARNAFSSAFKSVGFCVLLEGVMVSPATAHWLAVAALSYLVAINGVATGCTLSLGSGTRRKGAS
jgi:predicted Kef-type K+ transport protein